MPNRGNVHALARLRVATPSPRGDRYYEEVQKAAALIICAR